MLFKAAVGARRGATLVDVVEDTKPAVEEEAAAIEEELDVVDDVVATEADVNNPPPVAPPPEDALSKASLSSSLPIARSHGTVLPPVVNKKIEHYLLFRLLRCSRRQL